MSTPARAKTDKALAEMEAHLREIYSRANAEASAKWQAYMERADKRLSAAQDAYEAAKRSKNKALMESTKKALQAQERAITASNAKYRAMIDQTAAELTNVNKTAAAYINGKLPEIYALNYNEVSNDLGAKTGYSFNLVDQSTVKQLVTQDDNLLPKKEINEAVDKVWNRQALKAEVTQGIIQGESVQTIAKRFERVLGMNAASAMRNARTAVTGAENRGRIDMLKQAKEMGIDVKKVWSAISDSRTRDAHLDLDGKEAEVDEPFVNEFGEIMFPGDSGAAPANVYNCRCTLTYKMAKGQSDGRKS